MRSGRKSEPPLPTKPEKIDAEKLKKQRRKSDTFLSIAKETDASKSDRKSAKDSPLARGKSKSSSSINVKKSDESSTSKRKLLVSGNSFIEDVNKAAMFKILTKKQNKNDSKHASSPEPKSKSKIPVLVSPRKSTASAPASKALTFLEDAKVPEIVSNESDIGLRSCLHVYRPVGSVKKTITWPQDSNLEQVRYFEVDEEERTNFRRFRSETSLNLLGLEETSVDDVDGEEGLVPLNAAESPTKEILFQKCFGNVQKPTKKLLELPTVKCYAVGADDNHLQPVDETSTDLSGSAEKLFSGEPLHKWQSGLLNEIMDEFPEEFPNEPGNQWDKIRKRHAVGIEEHSDSPAKRAKMCNNRREADLVKSSGSTAKVLPKLPEEALNELDKFEEVPIRASSDQFHIVPTIPAEYHGSTEVLEEKMAFEPPMIHKRLSAPPGFCYAKNIAGQVMDSNGFQCSLNGATANVKEGNATSNILPRLKRLANYSFQ